MEDTEVQEQVTVNAVTSRFARLRAKEQQGVTSAKRLVAVLLATAGVGASVLAAAPTASAFTANGTVFCHPGPVTGVFVYAGSGSGWASYSAWGGNVASYSKNIGWNWFYHLSVGCGGTPSRWASSNYEGGNLVPGWSWNVVCGGSSCYAFDAGA
jgi:hypothetical protein